MSKPRIFISSTYYDLKHIRSSIENFVDSLGYEPVLFEKGDIAYERDTTITQSSIRDAQNCDVFVLIIGGRYGTPSSEQGNDKVSDKYESITKMEFLNAHKEGIPTYVFIEQAVYSEYGTYKKNHNNGNVEYAHVDDPNVFLFIDEIKQKTKNIPIQEFKYYMDIEDWLKKQWAGLFQILLSNQKKQKELGALSKQIDDLSIVSDTLKRYLEEVVSNVPDIKGKEIIKQEEERISEQKRFNQFKAHPLITDIERLYEIENKDALTIFKEIDTIDGLVEKIKNAMPAPRKNFVASLIELWKKIGMKEDINEVRQILGLQEIDFRE